MWLLSKVVLTKLQRQLWYLSEELVTLALFDPWSRWRRKGKSCTSLHTKVGDESPAKCPTLPSQAISGLQLQDMASANTQRFFQKLGLQDGLLDADHVTWLELGDFDSAAAFMLWNLMLNKYDVLWD